MPDTRAIGLAVLWSFAAAGAAAAATEPPVIPDVPRDRVINFTLYTAQNGVLKLTAQLYPLRPGESREVKLELLEGETWREAARTVVDETPYGPPEEPSARLWTAHFRVTPWDHARDRRFRVVALDGRARYEGRIRRDPVDKAEIVVAAFTGNSNADRRDKPDLIRNLKAQDPDLLFFSGDQVYDHHRHLGAWLIFGRQFGELTRDRPTVCLPDDHDIGQANFWGAGGVKKSASEAGDDGGYFHAPAYARAVEQAQTWHLPDPADPAPLPNGVGVLFTALNIGGVDFAILEDRKFKSGPNGLVPKQGPRPDHIRNPDYDPKSVDVPGAELLGERQLRFLRAWTADWRRVWMKCALSQTVFANAATTHGAKETDLHADLDSNGWPQTGRNRALIELRKGFAFHLCGDQHLATVIHHGVDDWEDAGWSFCVPSIVNYYNRWWRPRRPAVRRREGPLEFTGRYFDGFGNRITMAAYANPDRARENKYGGEWGGRADGYGLVRFTRATRRIHIECWPRGVDVTAPGAPQYTGWPVTIGQEDNYGRAAAAWLPELDIRGMDQPVVQVVDEADGSIVYTLRLREPKFRPKVFREGVYTVIVGDQDRRSRILTGLKASKEPATRVVELEP